MSNLRFGLYKHGRYIHAAPVNTKGTSGGNLPEETKKYLPDVYSVIAYAADGTKTAIFGSGSESNNIESLTFEINETGCGAVTMNFRKLPTNTELNYRQRIDIHLFNDSAPWWSGYIITRPVQGTTSETYSFTGHGYYNLLEKVIINKVYQNMETSAIVADIARKVESQVGLSYNSGKIISTGYVITYLDLDHVTVKEALEELADFAIDYVYGVDEYRELFFMPRDNKINEQARLWVGKHLNSYVPTWDVEKIVNHAYIKGGNVDDDGEQWLAEVSDAKSIAEYGLQESTWTLPSAYDTADAKRWGENQLEQYKDPVKSAKVTGVKLEYPKADGTFFVRNLSTQGQAAITTTDGETYSYPITKLKYTISASKGISLDMELGEQPFEVSRYFADLDRAAKVAELLQQASTKQLSGS